MKTLEEHLKFAQDYVMKGEENNTVIVAEGSEGKSLFLFADMPKDANERHNMFLGAGAKLAEDNKIGEFKKAILTTEAWVKQFSKEQDLSQVGRIEDYKDKGEVIVVTSLDVKGKSEMLMCHILRKGKYAVDFSKPEKQKIAKDALLNLFWQGYLMKKNVNKQN